MPQRAPSRRGMQARLRNPRKDTPIRKVGIVCRCSTDFRGEIKAHSKTSKRPRASPQTDEPRSRNLVEGVASQDPARAAPSQNGENLCHEASHAGFAGNGFGRQVSLERPKLLPGGGASVKHRRQPARGDSDAQEFHDRLWFDRPPSQLHRGAVEVAPQRQFFHPGFCLYPAAAFTSELCISLISSCDFPTSRGSSAYAFCVTCRAGSAALFGVLPWPSMAATGKGTPYPRRCHSTHAGARATSRITFHLIGLAGSPCRSPFPTSSCSPSRPSQLGFRLWPTIPRMRVVAVCTTTHRMSSLSRSSWQINLEVEQGLPHSLMRSAKNLAVNARHSASPPGMNQSPFSHTGCNRSSTEEMIARVATPIPRMGGSIERWRPGGVLRNEHRSPHPPGLR